MIRLFSRNNLLAKLICLVVAIAIWCGIKYITKPAEESGMNAAQKESVGGRSHP